MTRIMDPHNSTDPTRTEDTSTSSSPIGLVEEFPYCFNNDNNQTITTASYLNQMKQRIEQLERENLELELEQRKLIVQNRKLRTVLLKQKQQEQQQQHQQQPKEDHHHHHPIDTPISFLVNPTTMIESEKTKEKDGSLSDHSTATTPRGMLHGPRPFQSVFNECEEKLVSYFGVPKLDASNATIDIHGERYILMRSSSLTVEFFNLIHHLLQDQEKAWFFTRSLLFDLTHAMGESDAKFFTDKLLNDSSIDNSSSNRDKLEEIGFGPLHFALTGWATVTLREMNVENLHDREKMYIVYDHLNSFEADAFLKYHQERGNESQVPSSVPVCICNAGYSSGWTCKSDCRAVSVEILCRAKGDETCRFILAPPDQIARRIQEYKDKHPELADRIYFDPKAQFPSFFDRGENGTIVTVNDKAKERLDSLSHQFNLIQAEREKVTSLLNNILPEPIANEIAHGHKVKAEKRENACVLFADVANSVRIASSLTPEELVNWLNQIFDMFDHLTDKYGVEKIKTTGDCYVAATGILNDKSNKLDSMVDFCLEAIELLKEIKIPHTDESVPMRFGLHSGQCMCGVIGHKKYHYDILGDTCNVSSRMQQLGEPGRLHVTQVIYDQLKDNPLYQFEERGIIDVRGKGTMPTYWLTKKL